MPPSPAELVGQLRSFLPRIVVREVLAAREGLKVARTGLRLRHALKLRQLGEHAGFHVVIGATEAFPRRDRAKGGWCNGGHDTGRPGTGFFNIYIATDPERARRAHDAEESADDAAFGSALGTPACCSAFYDAVKDLAAKEQNDFFPFSAANTAERSPHALLNLGAQYFDASLVSHFPCSLHCAPSIEIARSNARLMYRYDPMWLTETLELLNHGCLYTEYHGVYLLPEARCHDRGVVTFRAQGLRGTSDARLYRALATSRSLHLATSRSIALEAFDGSVSVFGCTNPRAYAPTRIHLGEVLA